MIYEIKYFNKNRKISEKITHVNDYIDLDLFLNDILFGMYRGLRVSIEDVTALAMEDKDE